MKARKLFKRHDLVGPLTARRTATWGILVGDAMDRLASIPSDSVDCVVTSPPYWGLRAYGIGAAKGELGSEATPEEWCANQLRLFREVRRILKPHGTAWVNMGDSYAQGGRGKIGDFGHLQGSRANLAESRRALEARGDSARHVPKGLKPKDLIGQPWMLAFALRADGWYLRSDIIWSKPAPMPESIRDRPTKSHEYVFLLAKSERYYYDLDAIREPYKPESLTRRASGDASNVSDRIGALQNGDPEPRASRQPGGAGAKPPEQDHAYLGANPRGRNRRSVWEISSARFDEGHFATFPPDLVDPCIKAGTSEFGVCEACGKPWKRVIVAGEPDLEHQRASGSDENGEYLNSSEKHESLTAAWTFLDAQKSMPKKAAAIQNSAEVKARVLAGMREKTTVAWEPTCSEIDCPACAGLGVTEQVILAAVSLCGLLPIVNRDALLPCGSCAGSGVWRMSCAEAEFRQGYDCQAFSAAEMTRAEIWPLNQCCKSPTCGHPLVNHAVDLDACSRCNCSRFRFTRDVEHVVPALVFDPYSGAATTGMVARRLGRHYLGIEINPKYAKIGADRIANDELTRDFGGEKPKSEEEKVDMAKQMKLGEGW